MQCDLLVIGGGINGAAIARDAAGRGLSVALCEQDDLGSHTSSASTKLIHGGLRYLEHFEFALVRKALREREVLLRAAPHLIRPLGFVLPHDCHQRPAWMIRAGLFLYDHLATRALLPGSAHVSLAGHVAGAALKAEFSDAFTYADARVDDARLVLANAIDAAERGAAILTRTRCESAVRNAAGWLAALRRVDGSTLEVSARCLVNASGPWVSEFLQQALPARAAPRIRLVKGSHIVVPRLFDHPHAYIFQHADGRIVFAIPYEEAFTLIGTTDVDYAGDLAQVAIDATEVRYLCDLVNHYFRRQIAPADVVWSYAGVRPLVDEPGSTAAAVTRDYHFELVEEGAPMLSVFGGKITTCRKLAEEALDLLTPLLHPPRAAWTAHASLPGGDLEAGGTDAITETSFGDFLQRQQARYPWLPAPLLARYARAYGTRIEALLTGCDALADMGAELLPGLYEIEARYWIDQEWALTAEDMLWRRSKLGLHASENDVARLRAWVTSRMSALSE